jgi:hypothetical protein
MGVFYSRESAPKGPTFELPPEGVPMLFLRCGSLLEWWSIAKYQIPILNDQNRFGPPEADWSLGFALRLCSGPWACRTACRTIWYLIFMIWYFYSSSTPKEFAPVPAKPLNSDLTPRTRLSVSNIATSALDSATFLTRLLFHRGVSDREWGI